MANLLRFWFALHPDIPRPIGGIKQAHRLAEALIECGLEATIIQQNADFHPGWFRSSVPTIGISDWTKLRHKLSPQRDLVVLPETYLPLFESYAPGLPKIIFNQNASYSFGAPGSPPPLKHADVLRLYHHPDLLHVLCVSQYDEKLLSQGFGLPNSRLTRLINPIESDLFLPQKAKKLQIAYMPRKNFDHAAAVLSLLKQQVWFSRWDLIPIHRRSQSDVAQILQESLIFLAFGHPEGFGLPIAEALACGTALVGYSGLGGRELFELAKASNVGFEVAFGDWFGFVDSCSFINHSYLSNSQDLISSLLNVSKYVRTKYSQDALLQSVRLALSKFN